MVMKSTNPLKSFREARHISQKEFGDMIGVKAAMASHLENQRYLPSLPVFAQIYRTTHIPLLTLIEFFLGEQNAGQNSNPSQGHRRKNTAAGRVL
jgi:transcriptional regulator with XRE-family HTH domain